MAYKLDINDDNIFSTKKKEMKNETKVRSIRFYSGSSTYSEFSNFAIYPIHIDGITFPTVEHFYQWSKITNEKYKEMILQTPNPVEAKRIGGYKKARMRNDWDKIKFDVMYRAVKAKFEQHPELMNLLLNTGDSKLVHDSPWDNYWGNGPKGDGYNMLGKILMEIRDKEREKRQRWEKVWTQN